MWMIARKVRHIIHLGPMGQLNIILTLRHWALFEPPWPVDRTPPRTRDRQPPMRLPLYTYISLDLRAMDFGFYPH